jgi:hypothetical protein
MTDDLVAFLKARLDEDDEIARQASAGPWTKEVGYISGGPEGAVRVAQQAQAWNAAHIVRHDPERELREIESKRLIVDEYATTCQIRDDAAARIKAAGDHPSPADLDTWDRAEREAAILRGPVEASASVYAGHPDYREEWRP